MKRAKSLDAHTHIDISVSAEDVAGLNAGVLAATRGLDEAAAAMGRSDPNALWGAGLHPGLVRNQKRFDRDQFARLLDKTALVSEVGLDRASKVPFDLQVENFSIILELAQSWRPIVSVHSAGAPTEVLDAIEATGTVGAVLHWWLGDAGETERAVRLGCFFSINASSKSLGYARKLPRERILTETDHPYGDRAEGRAAQPGNVSRVEAALGAAWAIHRDEARLAVWRNFGTLIEDLGVYGRLPSSFKQVLDSL